jgi:hypothetical protein
MKTNQDGGSYSAKKPSAPGKEMARNQAKEGAGKMGYSQKFGPGRASGYDKGAMKAMDVMTHGGASKYMKDGPGQGFFSKLGRTISRGAGDIGTQILDLAQYDHDGGNSGSFGGFSMGGSRGARNQAANAKVSENRHYEESRRLANEGKTFGTLANYFQDQNMPGGIKLPTKLARQIDDRKKKENQRGR